jgi:cell volume regulation protein A
VPNSKLHGVRVGELRVPADVSVALIVRGETTIVPNHGTQLRHGDEVLIVAPRRLREATERRLRAVGQRGRLAGWLDKNGADDVERS